MYPPQYHTHSIIQIGPIEYNSIRISEVSTKYIFD